MKHIWSILCQNSVIDSETNNLSINSVLEQLLVTPERETPDKIKIINVPLNYEVVSLWVKENKNKTEKSDVAVEIVDPNGESLKTFLQTAELPESKTRIRTRFRIKGMRLTTSGNYRFLIKIKKSNKKDFRVVCELPLEVEIKKSPHAHLKTS